MKETMIEALPYKVKDLSQADFGRKEIEIAEKEMPGLMALRKEYAAKGAVNVAPCVAAICDERHKPVLSMLPLRCKIDFHSPVATGVLK